MAATEVLEATDTRATTAASLAVTFGPEADELLARIDYRYANTLETWERCVEQVVAGHVRSRYGR